MSRYLLLALCIACGSPAPSTLPEQEASVLFISEGPARKHRLTVHYRAPFVFGTHDVWITEATDAGPKEVFRGVVNNDGAVLGKRNVELTWEGEDRVSVTLRGQQQADATVPLVLQPSR